MDLTEEIQEWEEVVKSIQYKGWGFKVEFQYTHVRLEVIARVKNSEPPYENTTVHHVISIPTFEYSFKHKTSKDWKIKQVFRYICHIEVHEASEFFKVNDIAPFHAHQYDSKYREFEYPPMQYPEHI